MPETPEQLRYWNDTPTKTAIVDFVESVASDIPEEERVAVFDNDGTLWCEKPMPIELGFIHPRWRSDREGPTLRSASRGGRRSSGDLEWFGDAIIQATTPGMHRRPRS